ncbi:MAG: cysteine desulfurase [Salibacteraceae bacterium]
MKNFDHVAFRKEFPILSRTIDGHKLVYLDNAASTQKPLAVIRALEDYYTTSHANVHRGVHRLSQMATDAYEEARKKVARFVNAASDVEIVFTAGATESINLVAQCFGKAFIDEGDEIIISAMEHHSNIVPWQMACQEWGAALKIIPVTDSGELDLDAYGRLLNERIRLVAINHVSNTLGTVNPVKQIIDQAHDVGALVLVDGAQAAAHLTIDVQQMDVDFYCFSSHKMYGPTGIGILYGKAHWLEELPPYQFGGEMIESVSFDQTTFNVLPFKFEAGTPNIADAIGLGAAIDFINNWNIEDMAGWEQELTQKATESISQIEGVQLVGTADHKSAVLSFVVDGIHPYDIGAILDQQGVAVRTGHHCTQPLMERFGIPGTVRASFAAYNTMDEVSAFANALQKAIKMLR